MLNHNKEEQVFHKKSFFPTLNRNKRWNLLKAGLQLLVMLGKFVANLDAYPRRQFIKFISLTERSRRISISNGWHLKWTI